MVYQIACTKSTNWLGMSAGKLDGVGGDGGMDGWMDVAVGKAER